MALSDSHYYIITLRSCHCSMCHPVDVHRAKWLSCCASRSAWHVGSVPQAAVPLSLRRTTRVSLCQLIVGTAYCPRYCCLVSCLWGLRRRRCLPAWFLGWLGPIWCLIVCQGPLCLAHCKPRGTWQLNRGGPVLKSRDWWFEFRATVSCPYRSRWSLWDHIHACSLHRDTTACFQQAKC